MRSDLLALTADDLAALTNRGTVNRASRELDEQTVSGTVVDTAGELSITWSDGPTCRIAVGVALADAECNCDAVGLCRHLIRTVLHYQRQRPQTATPIAQPWDPGAITDEQLTTHFRGPQWAKLKSSFRDGVLVELVRTSKPTARFHQPPAVVRFQVPNDPRYTRCDCGQPSPCPHVPLAVWAFRELPAKHESGIVSNGRRADAAPAEVLTEIDDVLRELVEAGLSGATPMWVDRLTRLEARCLAANLVWPADVVRSLIEQQQRYAEQDALFAPDRLPELVGELLIRRDAIASDTGALPQLLIRGTKSDTAGTVGKAKYIGLGCGVQVGRADAEVIAYLHDDVTGAIAVVTKSFSDPKPETKQPPKTFAELGRSIAIKSLSFSALGGGQLLAEGAKRTASYRLTFARANASVQGQTFLWEQLKPPVLVEDFAELSARLQTLPPSSLRPRRPGEDFHVLPIARVEAAGFDGTTQTTVATLYDSADRVAYLAHPFTQRGRGGTEALLAKFAANERLIFVAGPVRKSSQGLIVHPVACVFDSPQGRVCVQPWIDDVRAKTPTATSRDAVRSPLVATLAEWHRLAEDVLTLGVRRADAAMLSAWQEAQRQAESLGAVRFAAKFRAIASELERKRHVLHWQPRPVADEILTLLALLRLSHDLTAT